MPEQGLAPAERLLLPTDRPREPGFYRADLAAQVLPVQR